MDQKQTPKSKNRRELSSSGNDQIRYLSFFCLFVFSLSGFQSSFQSVLLFYFNFIWVIQMLKHKILVYGTLKVLNFWRILLFWHFFGGSGGFCLGLALNIKYFGAVCRLLVTGLLYFKHFFYCVRGQEMFFLFIRNSLSDFEEPDYTPFCLQ